MTVGYLSNEGSWTNRYATSATESRWWPAFISTLPPIPLLAGIVTALVYVANDNWVVLHNYALGVGAVTAVVAWIGFAAIRHSIASPFTNTRERNALAQRLDALKAQLEAYQGPQGRGEHGGDFAALRREAEHDARMQLAEARQELAIMSANWPLATGYINVWNRLHRAEEALCILVPLEELIDGALIDDLRLSGMDIQEKVTMRHQIRKAVRALNPDMLCYLEYLKPEDVPPQPPDVCSVPPARRPSVDIELRSRAVLRGVRSAINLYRDDRRDGLVRARLQLLLTAIFTGLTTYVILALAVALQVDPGKLVAALTYYLVGTVVGFFGRLYGESQLDNVIEDYGLGGARLLLTPLLSGLAAIGGVMLLAVLPAVAGTVSSPAPAASAGMQVVTSTVPPAESIFSAFDLGSYQFGFLVAAVFGLTPALLITRLKQQSEQFAADLNASGVTTTGTAASK